MTVIVSGYDAELPITLKKDKATFAINTSATVKASLISVDRNTVFIAPVACGHTANGADWANSLVIVKFPKASTSALTDFGTALIEIHVDDSITLPWFVSIDIEKGTIS